MKNLLQRIQEPSIQGTYSMDILRRHLQETLSEDFKLRTATHDRVIFDDTFSGETLFIALAADHSSYIISINSHNPASSFTKLIPICGIHEFIIYLDDNLQNLFDKMRKQI